MLTHPPEDLSKVDIQNNFSILDKNDKIRTHSTIFQELLDNLYCRENKSFLRPRMANSLRRKETFLSLDLNIK